MTNPTHRVLQTLILAIQGEFAQEFYTDNLKSALVLANQALREGNLGSAPDEVKLAVGLVAEWETDD